MNLRNCLNEVRNLVLEQADTTPTTCQEYIGNVCDRFERKRVPMRYQIPIGKTQQQIDKEINETLEEYPLKYVACKDYIRHFICQDKLPECGKVNKPCKKSCEEVRENICFKHLKNDSKIYKWLQQSFNCKKIPVNGTDCDMIRTERKIFLPYKLLHTVFCTMYGL